MRYIDKDAFVSKNAKIIGNGSLHIEAHAVIEDNVLIDLGQGGTIRIGYRSKLKYGCVLRSYDGKITIHDRSTIGEYSILAGHGGLIIGNAVIIAGHSYISAAGHIFSGMNDHIRFQGEIAKGIQIDDGVWIGARCVILDGTQLGENSIIGAGSIVTKSLNSNMVCYGSPCREVYDRYIKEEIV
ncbi:acyltransferase [Sulfurimonas aquatica]|nr:acyltransferase [Sulfurimonas aquatica]